MTAMATMDPSTWEVVGAADDEKTLQFLLDRSLGECPRQGFVHIGCPTGTDRSVRIFARHAFEGQSIVLSRPINLGRRLIELAADKETRYPESEDSQRVKGWEIRKSIDEHGYPIVAATAAWVLTV